MFCRSSIQRLSDEVLVYIFSYLNLPLLLSSITLVCLRFHRLIESTSSLWAHVVFDFVLNVNKHNLTWILSHSRQIKTLLFGYTQFNNIDLHEINCMFKGASFQNLVWLSLSRTPISTWSYLSESRHLEIVNVSECENLRDKEFIVLENCNKLEHLYVGFTKIQPSTVQRLCVAKLLDALDACGIKFDVQQCHSILS